MSNTGAKHISAIVPIYNAEAYLPHCLDTLFGQTIAHDIEYIFIDDASTDASMNILREAVAKRSDLDVTILANETNLGSSTTRNTAFHRASGEYIMCLDSDDFFEPNMAELLLESATESAADIVMSPFFMSYESHEEPQRFAISKANINGMPISVAYFTLCGKLIKRSLIIDNNLFAQPDINCWEDLSITSRAMALTDRIAMLNTPLYHYRQNSASLTHSGHKKRLADQLFYADYLNRWFEAKGTDFYNKYIPFLERMQFSAKIKMLRGDVIEVTRWKNTYPFSCSKIIALSSQFGICYRIAFLALNACPTRLAIAVAKMLGKKAE